MADRVPLIVNATTSQIQELPVGDNLTLLGSSLVGVADAQVTGTLTSNNVVANIYNTPSDINLKENINVIPSSLARLLALRGVTFDWKNGSGSSCGVIAQEVEEAFPEVVSEINGSKHVNYDGLIGVLIEAVKELQVEVETLKKSINT